MKKGKPQMPPRWTWITRRGEQTEMIRLIYVDMLRAWKQDPPRDPQYREDTGYQTIRDYDAMRDYIKKRASRLVDIQYDEKTNECWISIPSPDNQYYRTNLTTWKTILRRWPAFIDPEFKRKAKA